MSARQPASRGSVPARSLDEWTMTSVRRLPADPESATDLLPRRPVSPRGSHRLAFERNPMPGAARSPRGAPASGRSIVRPISSQVVPTGAPRRTRRSCARAVHSADGRTGHVYLSVSERGTVPVRAVDGSTPICSRRSIARRSTLGGCGGQRLTLSGPAVQQSAVQRSTRRLGARAFAIWGSATPSVSSATASTSRLIQSSCSSSRSRPPAAA